MISFYITSAIYFSVTTATPSPEQYCVEQEFSRWQTWLTAAYPQRAELTLAMSSSRRLFEELLKHKFTSAFFKDYCYAYSIVRTGFDRCENSIFKQMVISGFGLADFICIERVYDFAAAIPCLQQANLATYISDECRWTCRHYANASSTYMTLVKRLNIGVDIMSYMAQDCSYLTCLTTCRRPLLEQRCGDLGASLEHEALRTIFSTSWDIYEPPEIRQLISRGFESTYPKECRNLATTDFDRRVASQLSINGETDKKINMTRVVFALSSDGYSTSPVMCSFENQLHNTVFGRFCSSTPIFATFAKLENRYVFGNISNRYENGKVSEQ